MTHGTHQARPGGEAAIAELPERPRLLPGIGVYRRGEAELQIGLDSRHAVVLGNLSPSLVAVLRSLDGTRRLPSLLSGLSPAECDHLRGLLAQLASRGLVTDATTTRHGEAGGTGSGLWALRGIGPAARLAQRCAHSHVRLHGHGGLLAAVTCGLAEAGIGRLEISAPGAVARHDAGCGYRVGDVGKPRAEVVAGIAREVNPSVRATTAQASTPCDLAVITDMVVPPPELAHRLLGERIPHLPVRLREGTGIIGPLVLPGRTSCLHCADLHRADRDGWWPSVAAQLAGRPQAAGVAGIHATAGLAVTQIIRAAHALDGPCPTWNTTLELDIFDGRVLSRPWPPHPRCGCGAGR
ncbi:hypothetical protein [Haloechinothrix sp. LS1_15]|uniref:hypothetical protein n=1 Tax=Haloechinothrix sp. LS1_15 TaxID=2652248 RepID=UPI002947FE99|nr:hypothetical protein [Haloechinothrix sp. LS1_15]MDV6014580.1 hypothetical protein [Haloechinothrix sp. LS1_15]